LAANGGRIQEAFEVRDKPISDADARIVARRCAEPGVTDAAIVAADIRQTHLREDDLGDWAASRGAPLGAVSRWRDRPSTAGREILDHVARLSLSRDALLLRGSGLSSPRQSRASSMTRAGPRPRDQRARREAPTVAACGDDTLHVGLPGRMRYCLWRYCAWRSVITCGCVPWGATRPASSACPDRPDRAVARAGEKAHSVFFGRHEAWAPPRASQGRSPLC
jgi:hypothetical protein